MKLGHRFLSHLIWALLSLMLTVVIVLGAAYVYMELQLPNVDTLKDFHLQVPLRIYSADDKLIAEYGAKRRIPVTLDQIPPLMIKAVLATEDARFYSHPGVDFIGLVRAARAVLHSGRKVQGASTITMQVARNFFLTPKKTYTRKIKEILLALKIDRQFSKDKILELYLNKVYFGNRAYGVAAAAQVYYGKNLKQLTLPEMAMIAGLPQAPSRNNPIQSPFFAKKRRNHVLARMLEVGFIDQKTYERAIKAPLTASYHELRSQVNAPYVAEMVRQVLFSEYGQKAYDKGLRVYTTINSRIQAQANRALDNGLIDYSMRHGFDKPTINFGSPSEDVLPVWQQKLRALATVADLEPAAVVNVMPQTVAALLGNGEMITINWSGLSWAKPALADGYVGPAPKQASSIVTLGDVIWVRQAADHQWQLSEIPQVQGALIAMAPQNGAILALTGGFDYQLSNFNRATQAERQPGSNFKPFIYSAALAKGYTLASVINDAPVVMNDTGENALWRPHNDTLRFYGPTRLRVALAQSRNLVSIRLLRDIGIPYTLNYVRRFGFDPEKLPATLSLALGSGTVTPMQIIGGYAVFANGGYRVVPHYIAKIIDQSGKAIYQADAPLACAACITGPDLPRSVMPANLAPQVLTAQNAYLMTQALRGVIQNGTGKAALVLKRSDLAGKTGTTNQLVDAWFSGFNSDIVATVWVGFDDSRRSLHEYGDQAALPIWIRFMQQVLQNMPENTMPQPPGIVTVRIDPNTGLLATPNQHNAIFEVFSEKSQPTQFAGQNTLENFPNNSMQMGATTTRTEQNTTANSEPLF